MSSSSFGAVADFKLQHQPLYTLGELRRGVWESSSFDVLIPFKFVFEHPVTGNFGTDPAWPHFDVFLIPLGTGPRMSPLATETHCTTKVPSDLDLVELGCSDGAIFDF